MNKKIAAFVERQQKSQLSKQNENEKNLPDKYLTKNTDLKESMIELLNDHTKILYIFVLIGVVNFVMNSGFQEPFVMHLCDLLFYLKPKIFLQVERAFVVNRSYITDLKKTDAGWMVYLGEKIKIPAWVKVRGKIKKSITKNKINQCITGLTPAPKKPNLKAARLS